ncbi:MAG: hypothetical protein ACR2PC_00770 [Tsuneonella suprasediminis]|uniref:Uncharacterized protein n=1 Tax=Tsuneonella suprasediminis TaxID=2306996 RepID=A0A419R0B0_9SPHN|nr:hypothetical protein [Tsuneonella suprasediminis]RJX66913.1 hypothetical protein D6858_11200 [Tsuneonella suprasediminis]UBS32270.1 hypothetical protein LBX01_12310 [Altererythrobacter sp. N1]
MSDDALPSAPAMTPEEKRAELREKIEAAEARNEQRTLADQAKAAQQTATDFVKAHPLATVAGALAIGATIAAIVPGPGRRLRKKATRRGSALAGALAELGIAYGAQLLDSANQAARVGQDRLEDIGDSIGDSARSVRREAGYLAGEVSDTARILKRKGSKKANRIARKVHERLNH